MKQFFLILIACAAWFTGFAQLTGVVVEEYDPTIACPDYVAPAGMTTYRVYAEFANPLDKVSALYGYPLIENAEPVGPCQQLKIETTTSWYNEAAFGTNLGSVLNCVFFQFVPVLAGDSWLTIGAECNADAGAAEVQAATIDPQSLSPSFNTNPGANLILNDGAIFNLFTSLSGFGSGPNNRVLLAQLTTTGEISFQLNMSVFLNNDASNQINYVGSSECLVSQWIQIDGSQLGLVYPAPLPGPGCTDPSAINYIPSATEEDGSCIYFAIPGCNDPNADNYDPETTVNDGSCIYNAGCEDLNAVEITVEGGSSPAELIWIILNPNGTVATSGVGEIGTTTQQICLADGCYTALMYDSFGDGWNGGSITITSYGDVIFDSNGPANDFEAGIFSLNADCDEEEAAILGCTDPAANNYNSEANEDDGSCEYDGFYEGPMSALEDVGPDIYLYPNPTGGDVTVDVFGANGAEALIVTVNDLMGRIIFQRNYGNDQERLRINIESSAYASGVYLLTVQNGAHVTTRHIVKQ